MSRYPLYLLVSKNKKDAAAIGAIFLRLYFHKYFCYSSNLQIDILVWDLILYLTTLEGKLCVQSNTASFASVRTSLVIFPQ